MSTQPEIAQSRRSRVEALAHLRALVAFLGEREQFAWWSTSFLSPTGLKFLEYNYPRTSVSAAIHSITHAAKSMHDQRIGKLGSFHLFRLPHEVEQDIHAILIDASQEEFSGFFLSKQQSIVALTSITEGELAEAVGPVRIASIGQLTSKQSLKKLAAYYRFAFQNQSHVFPYFTAE